MKHNYLLSVETGPDKGREFSVPSSGCDIGRSPQNDIVLNDGELSRKHCRLEFRNEILWITDLASANGTFINGQEVPESQLQRGDEIRIGASLLKVREKSAAGEVEAVKVEGKIEKAASKPLDLGLGSSTESDSGPAALVGTNPRKTLLWGASIACVLILSAFVIKTILDVPTGAENREIRPIETPKTLAVHFSKLEADTSNAFRYELSIETNGILSVEIDDLAQSRHVRRESENPVDPKLLTNLAREIEQTGLFSLDEKYDGIAAGNREADYDLVVIVGADVHSVRVRNRTEPEAFRDAREKLETFVRNELGLWAIEFSTEQLRQMALDALLLGQRLMQERDIRPGNLYEASKNFRECENLLETVEPKPDFFTDAVQNRRECEALLDERYKELNFAADRSIKLKEWSEAADELRGLMQLVPDRADDRNRDAERRLLDVENRLRKK